MDPDYGEGAPKNKKKALEWCRRRDTLGYDKAKSAVERLEGQIASAPQLKADAFADVLEMALRECSPLRQSRRD